MYLTAHHVQPKAGAPGINAFLSLHREQPLPLRGPDVPDIDYVSQFAGGYPVAEDRPVRPGGNTVTAYLDLVAPDAVSETELRSAVAALRARVGSSDRTPITVPANGVAARFGAVVPMDDRADERRMLLDRLEAAALALLPRRNSPPRPVSGPYVVWATAGAEGVRLWLPPVTLQRLPQSPARRARMLVPAEVLRDASGTAVDALGETAVALLGVGDADLAREGGVEIVDPQSAKTLVCYRGARPRPSRSGSA